MSGIHLVTCNLCGGIGGCRPTCRGLLANRLALALDDCANGMPSHFKEPHTIEAGEYVTLHGPITLEGGPCLCRWCKLRAAHDAYKAAMRGDR